jgi:hypothetical protein
MINWITAHGGEFNAKVAQDKVGWSLLSNQPLKKFGTIARIPKRLCISSSPLLQPEQFNSKLLPNAMKMMNALEESHWRARLGIALLSERIRADRSFYFPYIRNLPIDVRGLPIFAKHHELDFLQEPEIYTKTIELSEFLADFTDHALKPLAGTSIDPFPGRVVNVNAFGWSFSCASSRAIQPISIISAAASGQSESKTRSPVLIPGIDLAQHAFEPTCEVYDDGTHFLLLTKTDIPSSNIPLTISYGPFSNNELLMDYGFTVDDNPFDNIKIECDEWMVNTARAVMGQCAYSSSTPSLTHNRARAYESDVTTLLDDASDSTDSKMKIVMSQMKVSARKIGIGQRHDMLHDYSLSRWQTYWLRAINMYNEKDFYTNNDDVLPTNIDGQDAAVKDIKEIILPEPSPSLSLQNRKLTIGGEVGRPLPTIVDLMRSRMHNDSLSPFDAPEPRSSIGIDPRLWAYLRILYTAQEETLLRHGYDPWLLQQSGSLLTLPVEAHVLRTMMGIVAMALSSYETRLEQDIGSLINNTLQSGLKRNVEHRLNQSTQTEIIREECHQVLRSCFRARDVLLNRPNTTESLISRYLGGQLNLNKLEIQDARVSTTLREFYKFRVRRKGMLLKVLWQLFDLYQTTYFTAKSSHSRQQQMKDNGSIYDGNAIASNASDVPRKMQQSIHKWTAKEDESILQILSLSDILTSPFLPNNEFPIRSSRKIESSQSQTSRPLQTGVDSTSTARKNQKVDSEAGDSLLERVMGISKKYANKGMQL